MHRLPVTNVHADPVAALPGLEGLPGCVCHTTIQGSRSKFVSHFRIPSKFVISPLDTALQGSPLSVSMERGMIFVSVSQISHPELFIC